MTQTAKPASAWTNQFERPDLDTLRDHYPKVTRVLFDGARERILSFDDVTETLDWQGLPWRWCLAYTIPDDPTRAWVYLVPDPEKPRIAMPFTGDMLKAMPMHRFKRHLKDAFAVSVEVGPVFWTSFDVIGKSQLDDVLDVVKRKHAFVVASRNA